jgi:hypothetical protein
MMKRFFQYLSTICLLTLTTSLAQAGPIVLNFTDIPIPGGTDSAPFFTYQSQGFTLQAVNQPSGFLSGFQAHGPNSIFYAGAIGVAAFAPASSPDNIINLTHDNGKPFDILSIDLARNFPFDPAPTVTFTGEKAGGGTVMESFTVTTPVGTAAFQTFDFTGFTDLTAVSWGQPVLADGLHQFTNITLNTGAAVPEPASIVLVGIALFGFAALRMGKLSASLV